MSTDISELETRLATLAGRRHCVLTSRATAALYLAFSALGNAPGRIVFPAILCPSPAYAALYAGHQPLFCDVDPQTGNMSAAALDILLAKTPDAVAVMPVHLYGQPADMETLCAVAERRDVPVIVDAAQALGAAMADGTPACRFGVCAVLSFGHTKIVDAGYGGALVTDDDEFAETIRAAEAGLAEPHTEHAEMASAYRDGYYQIRDAAAVDPGANERFLDFPTRYRSLFVDRFDPARSADILRALDRLDRTLVDRRHKAAIYDLELNATQISPLHRDGGGAPWRYNVHVSPNEQKHVTEGLRVAGFDASNWYPSLHRWFEAGRRQDEATLPRALAHERSIINLWLDDATDDARVTACARALADLVSRSNSTKVAS